MKTVQIQISVLLKKPADQDPHYFAYNIKVHKTNQTLEQDCLKIRLKQLIQHF